MKPFYKMHLQSMILPSINIEKKPTYLSCCLGPSSATHLALRNCNMLKSWTLVFIYGHFPFLS